MDGSGTRENGCAEWVPNGLGEGPLAEAERRRRSEQWLVAAGTSAGANGGNGGAGNDLDSLLARVDELERRVRDAELRSKRTTDSIRSRIGALREGLRDL